MDIEEELKKAENFIKIAKKAGNKVEEYKLEDDFSDRIKLYAKGTYYTMMALYEQNKVIIDVLKRNYKE